MLYHRHECAIWYVNVRPKLISRPSFTRIVKTNNEILRNFFLIFNQNVGDDRIYLGMIGDDVIHVA